MNYEEVEFEQEVETVRSCSHVCDVDSWINYVVAEGAGWWDGGTSTKEQAT